MNHRIVFFICALALACDKKSAPPVDSHVTSRSTFVPSVQINCEADYDGNEVRTFMPWDRCVEVLSRALEKCRESCVEAKPTEPTTSAKVEPPEDPERCLKMGVPEMETKYSVVLRRAKQTRLTISGCMPRRFMTLKVTVAIDPADRAVLTRFALVVISSREAAIVFHGRPMPRSLLGSGGALTTMPWLDSESNTLQIVIERSEDDNDELTLWFEARGVFER